MCCSQDGGCIASESIRTEALPILRGVQAVPLCIGVKLVGLLQQAGGYGEEGEMGMVHEGVQPPVGGRHQHWLLCLHPNPNMLNTYYIVMLIMQISTLSSS